MRFFYFLFFILFQILFADNTNIIHNGQTFIAITSQKKPAPLKLEHKTFPWIPHPTNKEQKIALVSVPYKTSLKTFALGNEITLKVIQGNYKQEHINVDPGKAKPNKENLKRIAREREEANKIYSIYTQKRYWNSPFIYPLNSTITSPYGVARVFNKEVKSFHSGTDFRAAVGTPIAASNDGIVVIAKDRFLSGKGVVIDHGESIFSMYYHCDELKVVEGQRVKKGEIIALSGRSGRVSGPHLHFGFLVNGVLVDPLNFIENINKLMDYK